MKKRSKSKNSLREFSCAIKPVAKGKWDFFVLAVDYLYSSLRFRITLDEYMKYSFYNYSNRYRKNFLLFSQREKYYYFQKNYTTLSKYLFYKRIPDLYQRELILAPYCGEQAFLDFVKKHKRIIIKPDAGSRGKGIVQFRYTDDDAAKAVFAKFDRSDPSICEEVICQHKVLQLLNPFSCNTLRLVSVLLDGEVEIVSATLRIGANPKKVIDNLSTGGIGVQVDIETGIVSTFGKDYSFNRYTHHPITGMQLIGMQMPNWDKVIALVKTAHKRVPECLVYGWDIAVTEDGVDIVEANNHPGPRATQTMDQVPKGEKIIPLFKKNILKQEKPQRLNRKPAEVLDYEQFFQNNPQQ